MSSSTEPFFKPEKVSPRDKSAATDASARGIIEAEVAARERKTERLRELRLQKENEAPAKPAAGTKTRKSQGNNH